MPVAISPPTAFAAPNRRVKFSAAGGTPPYVFSVSGNRSGGSIDPASGLYLAGPRGLVPDVVTVTDATPATSSAVVTVSPGLYQNYQRNLGPPSLQLSNGRLLEGNFGAEKDVAFERARQGLLVGFPGAGAPDALDLIGAERQLPRAASESPSDAGGAHDQAFGTRLGACWDDAHGWLPAGSHKSLLYALDRAGFPMGDPAGAHIIQRHVRYSWLTGSGGTPVYGTHPIWTFDAAPPRFWNEFGILFGADVVGLSAGTPLAKQLNALVDLWRPRKARFMGTWVIVSGPTWGWPVGTLWGAGGRTWGGGVTRFVPPV
jgi:hypothetical protein